jgi:hypothetical protein
VAAVVRPGEGSLRLKQLATRAEQDAETECAVSTAARVSVAICLLCALEIAGSLESKAEF